MGLRLEEFSSNDPGNSSNLGEVEKHFGCALPAQYRKFMHEQDGGEGFIGGQYLILWRAVELIEFNREYEVEKYAPGLMLFGSTGGGEAFAFDTRDNLMRVVMIPFIGMSLGDVIFVADTFENFLSNLANGTYA